MAEIYYLVLNRWYKIYFIPPDKIKLIHFGTGGKIERTYKNGELIDIVAKRYGKNKEK